MKSFKLGKLAGRPIAGLWLAGLLLAWAPAAPILAATPTVVRVVNAVIGPTSGGTVSVEMVASGEESALSFSLVFDPARLTFGNAALGAGASTASLFVNSSQAASGRVGIVVGVSPGQAFPVGQLELLRLTFTAGTVSGPTPLAFGNLPVVREISDRLARPLAATFTDGSVLVGNRAPVLNAIPSQTVAEGNPATFTAVATDPDLPRDTLTFSFGGNVPAGAAINPATGVFTWIPSESQGPTTAVIAVTVTENGTPVLSDSENVTITVNEINSSPSITPVGSQTVAEGNALSFTVNANDPDIPANGLV